MSVDMIDSSNIIIDLCEDDISGIKKETGEENDLTGRIKKLTKVILNRVMAETGIDLSERRIIMEALPYSGGCLVLLRLSERKARRSYRIVRRGCTLTYFFSRAEDVLSCINRLYLSGYEKLHTNLMSTDNGYYLIFHCVLPKRSFSDIMNEYAIFCRHGEIFAASAAERSLLLCRKDTISRIGRLLI